MVSCSNIFFLWIIVRGSLFDHRVDGDGRFKISFKVKYLILFSPVPQLVAFVPLPLPRAYRFASIAPLEMLPRLALFLLHRWSLTVRYPFYRQFFSFIHAFSCLAFEGLCSTVVGVPSVTINTNPGTVIQSMPAVIAPSTTIVPVTTVPQIVIGPSSTTSTSILQASSSTSSAIGGLPLQSNAASPNKIFLHWTVTLLGLAAGNLLVF